MAYFQVFTEIGVMQRSRFVIWDHFFHKLIHLNYWSEILRPPLFYWVDSLGTKLGYFRSASPILSSLGTWLSRIVRPEK